jgi:hypothetical protein
MEFGFRFNCRLSAHVFPVVYLSLVSPCRCHCLFPAHCFSLLSPDCAVAQFVFLNMSLLISPSASPILLFCLAVSSLCRCLTISVPTVMYVAVVE